MSDAISFQHGDLKVESVGDGRSSEQAAEDFAAREKERADQEARDRGEKTQEETEKEEVSEAASRLGRKGGKAPKKPKAEKESKEEAEEESEGEESEEEESEADDNEDEGEEARKKVAKEIEEAPPHKKKQLASERVAEATRENAQLKREMAQLRREMQALRQPPQPPKPAPDKKEFEGREDDYLQAQIDHKVEQELARRQREQSVASQRAMLESIKAEREENLQRSIAALKEKDPDFRQRLDERVGQAEPAYNLPYNVEPGPENYISSEIMLSDDPMRLYMYLSEHPEEFQRLAALSSPRLITRETARIEDRLDASLASPPKRPSVSKAPPPPQPVRGAPPTAEQGWRPGMSLDDYAQHWRKSVTRQ